MQERSSHETSAEATRQVRNTIWLECYHVIVRVGWIFKTETIIMPAVLDAVVDAGLLRGLLPVLNRGGQSLPPLLFAGAVARRPRKKWLLLGTTVGMAGCFAALALVWGPLRSRPDLLAIVFLILYAAFSLTNGLTQLVAAALQGKLVPAGHRGRALLVGTSLGSVAAIAAALVWLGPWLEQADGFQKIFGITALFFALAALAPLLLDEPADSPIPLAAAPTANQPPSRAGRFADALREWRRLLARDRALARVSLVAACFSAVIMLFPHYQAFARDRLGMPISSLLTWVVVQNIATGIVSLVAGPVADRRGTKVVLVALMAGSALTPLVVTVLSVLPGRLAADWFWLTYAVLGLNPISLRIFTNYALELAPTPFDHARYVSVVGAALGAPFVLSPLVGAAVDAVGFRGVFVLGAAVIAAGAVVAAGLPEPRIRG